VICGASSALVRVTSVLTVAPTPAIEGKPALKGNPMLAELVRGYHSQTQRSMRPKTACEIQASFRSSYNKHRPRGGEPGVWRRRLTDVLGGVYLTDANIRQLLRHKQMSATIGVRCKQGTQQLTGEHIEKMRLAV